MDVTGLEIDRRALAELCRSYGVARLEVFGSFARGDAEAGSDLDLLVTFHPGVVHGMSYLAFACEIETLVGRRIDLLERPLVEQDDRRPVFRQEVLKHVLTLYRDESVAA